MRPLHERYKSSARTLYKGIFSCVLSVSSYLMLSTIVWSYNGSRAPCMMLSPEPALPRAPACARAIDRVGLQVHPLGRAGTRGQAGRAPCAAPEAGQA